MKIDVFESGRDKVRRIGEYDFLACPRIGDVIRVSGPMGDLDLLSVVRIEHYPIELPRSFITEEKAPYVAVYVEFESRFCG